MESRVKKKPGDWFCPRCYQHNFARNNECFECGEKKDDKCVVQFLNKNARDLDYSVKATSTACTSTDSPNTPVTRCKIDWLYCTGACAEPDFDLNIDVMEGFTFSEEPPPVHYQQDSPTPSLSVLADDNWRAELDQALKSLGLLSAHASVGDGAASRQSKTSKKSKKSKKKELRDRAKAVVAQKNFQFQNPALPTISTAYRPNLLWEDLDSIKDSQYFEDFMDDEIDDEQFESINLGHAVETERAEPDLPSNNSVELIKNSSQIPKFRVVSNSRESRIQEDWWRLTLASGYNEEYALMRAMQDSALEAGQNLPKEFSETAVQSQTKSPLRNSSSGIPRPSRPEIILRPDQYFDFFEDEESEDEGDTDGNFEPSSNPLSWSLGEAMGDSWSLPEQSQDAQSDPLPAEILDPIPAPSSVHSVKEEWPELSGNLPAPNQLNTIPKLKKKAKNKKRNKGSLNKTNKNGENTNGTQHGGLSRSEWPSLGNSSGQNKSPSTRSSPWGNSANSNNSHNSTSSSGAWGHSTNSNNSHNPNSHNSTSSGGAWGKRKPM